MIYAMGRNHEEFVANTPEDIDKLPKEKIEMGSACIVISTGDLYMFNGSEWELFGGES